MRQRHVDRGARRLSELDAAVLTLLRPALEAVMEVVRAEASLQTPAAERRGPPKRLAPLLRFARLPDAALATVLRVVVADDGLRARVAAAVGPSPEAGVAKVGEAGWAFLSRPEGWDEHVRTLAQDLVAEAVADAEDRSERVAARRLAAVEAELRAASDRLATLEAELSTSSAALAAERRARRRAEDAVAALETRLAAVEKERDAAHRRASALERSAAEGSAVEPGGPGSPASPPSPSGPAPATRPGSPSAAAAPAPPPAAVPAVSSGSPSGPSLAAPSGPPPAAPPGPPRRLPQPLPPGLLDDTPEAADALVKVPRALLVVDGYNASIRTWPGMAIAEQRDRLTSALAELASRTGVRVVVAFDGVDRGATVAAGIQVRFSEEGQQADDLILDLLDATPVDTPVLVATDDQRVRRLAAAKGANVLTQAQLFWLLRRER